jgi:hypothetical protein
MASNTRWHPAAGAELEWGVPTVAIVEAVKIQFFAREHPPPHFHAVFAEHRAQIQIATLQVIKGSLPNNKLRSVISWAETRQDALMTAWDAISDKRNPEKIV